MRRHDDMSPGTADRSSSDRPHDDRGPADRRVPSREQLAAAMRRAQAAIAQARALKNRPARDSRNRVDDLPRVSSTLAERLALSESRFRALVAVAGHTTWTLDPTGAITSPQPAWQAFTGQRYQDTLALGGHGWTKVLHPDDRQPTIEAFDRGLAGGRMFELGCRIRRASETAGYEWRNTLMRAVPVHELQGDGIREWVVANTDVTEFVAARDEAEAMLREREDHYRHAVELNPQIPWTANAHGRVFDISPRWFDLTGFERGASREQVWHQVQHPADVEAVRRAWRRARRTGEPLDVEHRVRLADGSYRFMRSRAAPRRDAEGRITHWYGTTEDVDQRLRAERAEQSARRDAERARDAAEAARRVAEAAVAAKGRILAAASHDLRSPLVAIARYSDILQEEMLGPLTPGQRGVIERMGSAREHLLTLINDILRAAEAESNEVELIMEDVNVSHVCTMLDELVEPQATARGIRFQCRSDGADDLPIIARADSERLLQVLVNLASNALKFTESGGLVRVVASNGEGGRVMVRVSDTGRGIAHEEHESIFLPFVQRGKLVPGLPSAESGVGLGLATSRTLARRMGGEISVSSEVGVGSVFTVVLPAAARLRDADRLATPESTASAVSGLQPSGQSGFSR